MSQRLKAFQKHFQGMVKSSQSFRLDRLEQLHLATSQTLAQNGRKRSVMLINDTQRQATTCSTILLFRVIVEVTRSCV